jgi:hypothetical protein
MTLSEILEYWIDIREREDGFEIYVDRTSWNGPHTTTSEWVLAYEKSYTSEEIIEIEREIERKIEHKKREYEKNKRRMNMCPGSDISIETYGFEKCGITNNYIQLAVEKVLDRKTFFKICDDCGVRKHTFHISGRICDSCIPHDPDIVY